MTQRDLKSSFPRAPKPALGAEDLHALRRRAWQDQGIPSFDLKTIFDDWTRQAIINEADRQYGKRRP